jgi:hypothetical protein
MSKDPKTEFNNYKRNKIREKKYLPLRNQKFVMLPLEAAGCTFSFMLRKWKCKISQYVYSFGFSFKLIIFFSKNHLTIISTYRGLYFQAKKLV